MQEERRIEPRTDTLKTGRLLIPGKREMFFCLTHNLSARGAKIEVEDPMRVPDEFDLVATEGAAMLRCRVLWRIGTKIGVVFI
ncbi:PilZ domain-containing protein [Methylobacterium dankookense]|uniref:PilZ domain-containing protein n=1 Tax=Methylobacterium dankookense TaxID=560405 RepID=A0A564FZA1_9HYPH|nr:PilZ domain-containing protein [Methylobacterium dankookense]GJD58849.1 hypothetical protein IFDJLNFL_4775 [Methylobacterium dankookense]VUF13475.1 hypothetical protein MTDSW087_03178 [Methylobacterium dankookense]